MLVNEASSLRLDEGQVDIWLTPLDDIGQGALQGYRQLLSEDEHAKWRRFVVPEPRLQFLVARAHRHDHAVLGLREGVDHALHQLDVGRSQ